MKPKHVTQKLIEDAMGRKGFALFTDSPRPYNLNLISVRDRSGRVTNKFDDVYTVSWYWRGEWNFHSWAATTDPGKVYTMQRLLNPKGAAILCEGQHRGAWQLGRHRGKYRALVQRKAVPVYRDRNMDAVLDMDPSTIDIGWHGINHHRAAFAALVQLINMWSAGCQVVQDSSNYHTLIQICERAEAYWGAALSYTVLREEEVFS